jgi:hypothetical protein
MMIKHVLQCAPRHWEAADFANKGDNGREWIGIKKLRQVELFLKAGNDVLFGILLMMGSL